MSTAGDDTPTAVSDNLSERGGGAGEKTQRSYGKVELRDEDCADKLGFAFSSAKKWTILR